jgi:uncharacterized protein (TIGR02118 family)
MIKVSVMYPAGEGKTFDMAYYLQTHRPLAHSVFGDALKRFDIDKGLSGPFPGSEPPYAAIGHLYFESVEAFLGIMMKDGTRLMEDIPNYTNGSPTIQVSEVIP